MEGVRSAGRLAAGGAGVLAGGRHLDSADGEAQVDRDESRLHRDGVREDLAEGARDLALLGVAHLPLALVRLDPPELAAAQRYSAR